MSNPIWAMPKRYENPKRMDASGTRSSCLHEPRAAPAWRCSSRCVRRCHASTPIHAIASSAFACAYSSTDWSPYSPGHRIRRTHNFEHTRESLALSRCQHERFPVRSRFCCGILKQVDPSPWPNASQAIRQRQRSLSKNPGSCAALASRGDPAHRACACRARAADSFLAPGRAGPAQSLWQPIHAAA